jgi:pyruvate dehydrogenase phosphatase
LYNLYPGFRDVSPWEEFLRRNKTPPYVTAKPEVIHRKLRSSPSDPPPPPLITFTPASTDSLPNYGEPEPEGHTVPKRPTFLVLASDGFADLCGNKTQQRLVLETWARSLVELWYFGDVTEDAAGGSGRADDYMCTGNLALRLLRRALGDNRLSVSKVLTLESESAGIDDTTIIVQTV